jgi:hypothetical protein
MTAPAPRAETVLRIWERGRREHPIDRALTMLSALTQRPRDEVAAISVERRDVELLAWRTTLFGPELPGYASCPQCGCGVDVALRVDGADNTEEQFTVVVGGRSVPVRLPTSLDVAAVAGYHSLEQSRQELITRCIADCPATPDEELCAAVEAEWERRATLSAGAVALRCPDCDHHWELDIDIAEFLWREIEIAGVRLLHEVDRLARRYGWTERDILALSATRRRLYLELAS